MKTWGQIALLAALLGCSPTVKVEHRLVTNSITKLKIFVPSTELFEDFSDSTGARKLQDDGQQEEVGGELNNLVYPYAQVSAQDGGNIRLKVTEDDATKGPDGKPGVLRFEIESISGTIDHFGLVYVGNNDSSEIRIKAWEDEEVTREELDGSVLEFRYRMDKKTGSGTSYNVRLEPEIEESWSQRADFGAVTATAEWQVFTKPISAADNLDVFLKMLNAIKPERFKIVWGQEGPSSNYANGDALLIDDIRIVTPETVITPDKD